METARTAAGAADVLKGVLRRAQAAYAAGKLDEAESHAREALRLSPRDADVWNALGVFRRMKGEPTEASYCYRQALEASPRHGGAWSNLGNALKDLHQIESAIFCHRQALAIEAANPHFLHNYGIALIAGQRQQEAVDAFDKALQTKPGDAQIRWDRTLSLLQLGDFKRGWVDYDARLALGELPARTLPGRQWRGERYRRKSLLVVSEQGFGDAIWAARYLRAAKELGGVLIVECRKELAPLIEGMAIADQVIVQGSATPDADFHCYQCSLPSLFTPTLKAIPPAPYIAAAPERRQRLAAVMGRFTGKLRVGIVWSGSTTSKVNAARALPLRRFLQAFAVPGVQLFSLQKGPPRQELVGLGETPLFDLDPHLRDFADTAAALAELDLIVMTDSAVAHLAGAMGRPCWLLLNHVPFWLWFKDRGDSPWYPSLRLFRPRGWGEWTGVIDAAAVALMDLAARGAAPTR